jgi:outer membrane receptor protein involved in Fe transport
MNSKISYAVAAILGGASFAATAADTATTDTTEAGTETLAEITVTAQRRTQNMQDVPISMQALTAETLQQLNVATFDDYIKTLPNVTTANNGPGQNEVFMRGLSAGSQASQGSASTGLWPNVAIYLDNQSGQLPNRNLDIYAADLNRIEVLEGPQGTLFGAGAEAGVIRYITNEPKLDVTEGSVKAGYGWTAGGDPNTDVTAVLNVPLIENTMAVRAWSTTTGAAATSTTCRRPSRAGHRWRHRHSLCELSGGRRRLPGRRGEQWLLRAARQPGHQSTTPTWWPMPSTRSPIRACASRHCTSSTMTGTR